MKDFIILIGGEATFWMRMPDGKYLPTIKKTINADLGGIKHRKQDAAKPSSNQNL